MRCKNLCNNKVPSKFPYYCKSTHICYKFVCMTGDLFTPAVIHKDGSIYYGN